MGTNLGFTERCVQKYHVFNEDDESNHMSHTANGKDHQLCQASLILSISVVCISR